MPTSGCASPRVGVHGGPTQAHFTSGLVSQLGTASVSSVTASLERKENGEGGHRKHRIFRPELKGQLLYNLSGTAVVLLVQTGLNKTRSQPRIERLLQTCEQIINSNEDRGCVIKMERTGFCPYIYPCKSRTKDFLDYICTFLSPLLH